MPSEDKTAIGKWIRAIREGAGMTQKQLAAAVGTDGPHVIAWEKGRSVPGGRNLLAILQACNVRLIASTEPPALQAPPPDSREGLAEAIEALTGQMAALADAAVRLAATESGVPLEEEASG